MPVLTSDILLEDVQRDDLFEWLGNLDNHALFLQSAVQNIQKISPTEFSFECTAKFKSRTIGYILHKKDNEHGGRRIKIQTTGKRSSGILSYSLRTMKPSRNTMLTITWDYQTGSILGMILNQLFLEEAYLYFLHTVAQNIEKNKSLITG